MKSCKAEVVKGGYNVAPIDGLPSVRHGIRLCLQCDEANKFCNRLLDKLFSATGQLRIGRETLLHYAPDVCYGKKGVRSLFISHF